MLRKKLILALTEGQMICTYVRTVRLFKDYLSKIKNQFVYGSNSKQFAGE